MTSVFDDRDGLGLAQLVRSGEVSASELLEEAIERTEKADETLSLVAHQYYDFARKQIAQGLPEGPFTGLPFLRKDTCGTIAGLSDTSGAKLLKDNKSTVTSELATRYMNAGLVIYGATKVPTMCYTIDASNAWYGPVRNPWDLSRTPGGSSSGAAAAVGAGVLPMAHGNDGGGSLRVPAAWSGCFTVKPSRGRYPDGPVYTEAWMGMATEGTITRSVRDCAAMMDAVAGDEIGSRYSSPAPARSYLEETRYECRSLRIAVMDKCYGGAEFDPEHLEAVHKTVKLLQDLGHIVEFSAPEVEMEALSSQLYKTVAVSTVSALNLIGKSRGRPVLDEELKALVATFRRAGETVTGLDYAAVNDISMETAYAYDKFMHDSYDLVLSPTMPVKPLKLGEIFKQEDDFEAFRHDQDRYLNLTQVQNVTGQPAMSVPLWWGSDNLPIGMMFVARYGDESTLFSLAAQLERTLPWWDKCFSLPTMG